MSDRKLRIQFYIDMMVSGKSVGWGFPGNTICDPNVENLRAVAKQVLGERTTDVDYQHIQIGLKPVDEKDKLVDWPVAYPLFIGNRQMGVVDSYEGLPTVDNEPMSEKWFNDPAQVQKAGESLEELWKLIHARRDARRVLGGDVANCNVFTTFIVRGAWHLDEFAQVSVINEVYDSGPSRNKNIDLEELRNSSKVITHDEFMAYLGKRAEKPSYSRAMGGTNTIPRPHIPCATCGKLWEMNELHDCHATRGRSDLLSGEEWIGKTIKEVRELVIQKFSHAAFMLDYTVPVLRLAQGDKVEMESYNRAAKLTTDKHQGEKMGYQLIDDSYVIQPGDYLNGDWQHFYHKQCRINDLTEKVAGEFTRSLMDSGYGVNYSIRIPNEYGSQDYRGDWLIFLTNQGYIRLGWRKRVIEAQPMIIGKNNFNNINHVVFTPVGEYKHCDNYEDLTNYLKEKLNEKGISKPAHPED